MYRILLILLNIFFVFELSASTLGIVTGKYTVDGRPLLLKNKDRSDAFPSDVNVFHSEAEYDFVYQVNDGQSSNYVRMGINEWGLGIVYTDSENLVGAETGPSGSQLTSIAMKSCKSIEDFRALLLETNGERTAHNHYGVIDSSGNGAIYEVDGFSFVEFPVIDTFATMANTAKFHPSRTAPVSGSTSPQREFRMMQLFSQAPASGITYQYCMEEILKDFSSSQDDEDAMPQGQYETNAVLSRYKTATGGVLRGIKPGDSSVLYSIMQLCIGEPSSSLALPYSFVQSEIPDEIRSNSADYGIAGVQDLFRQKIYDYTNGRYADRTVDTDVLYEIQESLASLQNELYLQYDSLISAYSSYKNEQTTDVIAEFLYDIQLEGKSAFQSVYEDLFIVTNINSNLNLPIEITLKTYPNPSNAEFTVKWSGNIALEKALSLDLYDLRGKLIFSKKIDTLNSDGGEVKLSSKKLSSGRYYICIRHNQSIINHQSITILK